MNIKDKDLRLEILLKKWANILDKIGSSGFDNELLDKDFLDNIKTASQEEINEIINLHNKFIAEYENKIANAAYCLDLVLQCNNN